MNAPTLQRYTSHYPDWAKQFARQYVAGTLTQFILHGNTRDLVPAAADKQGGNQYVPLRDFLSDDLFASRDVVLFYDRSAGLHFADEASQRDFNRALSGYDTIFGTEYAQKMPKDPVRVFSVLENYFRLRLAAGRRIACIIDYAETVAPMNERGTASADDRAALVFLQKWAHDPSFEEHDFTVCLITENLTALDQQLTASAHTAELQIPMPDEPSRRAFISDYSARHATSFDDHSSVSKAQLARNTAGLGYVQLRTLLADVLENHTRLTHERLTARKKEMIEEAAHGMLAFVDTDHDLDMVAGHRAAKEHLRQAARALRKGRRDVIPMGYLVSGPVGTGKTFLITCFAGEIGIPMVKLQNFRSQWQGATESNLERILNLLEAMTPVAVMIDEADAALGRRNAQGDSGVSQRVFAKMAAFMSDPSHRGRILFFLVTARPDLMPVDLKRQGRAEEHLALFYPSDAEERRELLEVMMERTDVDLDPADAPSELLSGERPLSGADMEALLTRAKFRSAAASAAAPDDVAAAPVTPDVLKEAVNDFIPPTYPVEVEMQTLAAVLECTSRNLLPTKYRQMDRETIVRRLEELKQLH